VFSYVARTAERVKEGVRWRTLSYDNRPQYDFSVFNVVAGISFFLADYARLTGQSKPLELARDALQWCESARLPRGFSRGLYVGRTGLGMAWLHLARVSEDQTLLPRCALHAQRILDHEPGPVTDILGGAAGNGLFLLRLWEATRDDGYLAGAVRNAEWLESIATRTRGGCSWQMAYDWHWGAEHYLGFAHGLAGIAYFLIALFAATRSERWEPLARTSLRTLTRLAKPDHGGLNWPIVLEEPDELSRCQWCHGAPGVGLTFAKAYEVWREPGFLRTAEAAAEATLAYGDVRRNPSQCHGLAGNAELFLELYRRTHKSEWLERARGFAERAFAYRHAGPEGDTWQADEAGYSSPDFMCGAAGTGHFFLRLLQPERLAMPLS
jgi:lantibiotic modifying enzyme